MKAGDTVEVTIAGQVVAQAKVTELADGTATLVVPATKVIMGVRTTLTDLPAQESSGTQTIVDGVHKPEPVAVEETPQNDTNTTTVDGVTEQVAEKPELKPAPVEPTAPVAPVEAAPEQEENEGGTQ